MPLPTHLAPLGRVQGDPPAASRAVLVPSLHAVYATAVVAIAVAAAFGIGIRAHDFWWHLANGRTIVETGVLPRTDTFTYTQHGEPFFNQMWLAQSAMYVLHRSGGAALVLAAHAAAIGLTYGLLLRLCVALTGRVRLPAVVMLGVVIPVSFYNWAVRPQAYALPLFVAFLLVLWPRDVSAGMERGPRRLWSLPLLMALWVNIHGSFVLGLAAVTMVAGIEGLHLLRGTSHDRRAATRMATFALLTWVAALANPAGPGVFAYVARMAQHPSVAEASEWQAVRISDASGMLFVAAVACVVILMIRAPRRPTLHETLLVTAFLVLGFTAERNTVWFAMVAAPTVALQTASILGPPRSDNGSAGLNAALMTALAAAVVLMTPWVQGALPDSNIPLLRDTAVEATEHLQNLDDVPERIFNDIGYGSYLPWAAADVQTFIDPRFELFPLEQIHDYKDLSEGRFVDPLTEKYRIDGFLVSHIYQADLIRALRASPDWREDYSDEEAAVFLPTGGAGAIEGSQ